MPKISNYPLQVGPIANTDVVIGNVAGVTKQIPKTSLLAGFALIEIKTVAAVAVVDFALPVGFDDFQILIDNLRPATSDTELWLRLSQDAGVSFVTTNGYRYTNFTVDGTTTITRSSLATEIQLHSSTAAWGLGSAAGQIHSLQVDINRPLATDAPKPVRSISQIVLPDGTSGMAQTCGAFILNNNACNAVRFLMGTGNITTGKFRLFGRVGI